jgi:hypothetical protein
MQEVLSKGLTISDATRAFTDEPKGHQRRADRQIEQRPFRKQKISVTSLLHHDLYSQLRRIKNLWKECIYF